MYFSRFSLRCQVHASLQGIHATVFAYGQTATGKTYTLQGTPTAPGVIPMAVHDCFANVPEGRVGSRENQGARHGMALHRSGAERDRASEGFGPRQDATLALSSSHAPGSRSEDAVTLPFP
jgi:hypothetical protein